LLICVLREPDNIFALAVGSASLETLVTSLTVRVVLIKLKIADLHDQSLKPFILNAESLPFHLYYSFIGQAQPATTR
jgi:hypothetical protein